MKFSLFYEMQLSDPTRESEARIFHECVEQAVLADDLGYHCIWEVEHHGLREYSHSSAPEVFLAFVAAKTKRIRIGHGVTLLPHRYSHPIRIAERVATLDILSEGRVNWGSGKSSSLVEQAAFESDISTLHDQWAEAIDMIPRMWKEEVFEHKGRFFNIPPTQIIPKPVQTPHPPMFAACSRPSSAAFVGSMGLGALNSAVGPDEFLRDKVIEYRKAVEAVSQASLGCRQKNNWFAATQSAIVLEDDMKAVRYAMGGARFFGETLNSYYLGGKRPVGRLPVTRDLPNDNSVRNAIALRDGPNPLPFGIIGGHPAAIREAVRRLVDTGIDELMCIMQMGMVPHEITMASIRTFGEKVMPYFA